MKRPVKKQRRVPSIEERAAWAALDAEQRKGVRAYLKWILGQRLPVFRASTFLDVERQFEEAALARAVELYELGTDPTHHGKIRTLTQIGAAMVWLRIRIAAHGGYK